MMAAVVVILLACAVVVGLWHARVEARMIADNIAHGRKEDLPHVDLWLHRAALLSAPVVASSLLLPWDIRYTVAAIAVEYGAFAVAHRWRLNTLRSLPATYLAPGNVYDRTMIRLAWVIGWGSWPNYAQMRENHTLFHSPLGTAYRKTNALAGRIAYIVEVAVFVAGGVFVMMF